MPQDQTENSNKMEEPRREKPKFEEFQIPEVGISPITGLPGTPVWGALNKPSSSSRWVIGDAESDDEINWFPCGGHKLQLPGPGATFATLSSPIIWLTSFYFNGGTFLFALCQNGHIYQITPGGVITDVYGAGQFNLSGHLTNGSNIVTALSSTTQISVGQSVSGTGLAGGTTVTSVDSSSQIHVSNNFTGTTGTETLSFSTPLFTTSGIVDIVCWQGTTMLFGDSAAQKIYSWDGTNFLIVFNAQPVNYLAVFQNRLWIGFQSTVEWTNVNTFNSLLGDSGSYLITDSGTTNPITCMVDTPYGLIVAGANWFKTITNLTDIGSPAVLTFQQNTIEAQIGILNKWSVITIGNVVFFANTAGVWAFEGSQPAQISNPYLNGFFTNTDFTKTSLAAAYGMIAGWPCLFIQSYYKGDTQVAAGYTVFGYTLQGTQWFRYSNGTVVWITGLVSEASTNNNPIVWGCDGTNIFTLFSQISGTLTSQWNSKLWNLGSSLDIDNVLGVAIEFIVNSGCTIDVAYLNETNIEIFEPPQLIVTPLAMTWVNNLGQTIQFINNSLAPINFGGNLVSVYTLFQGDGAGRVRRFGLNVQITGSNCAMTGVVLSLHRTGAAVGK